LRNLFLAGLSAAAIAASLGLAACATDGGGAAKTASASAKASSTGPMVIATRRVNEGQYRNTVADLFGADIQVNARFEPELRSHGLLAIGAGKLSITTGGFEQYYAVGRSISDQVLDAKRRDKFATCKPADLKAADDACTAAFVKEHGRKLFRRPLDDAEIASRVALARSGATQAKDYYAGLKLALTSLLTSPDFLFRVEVAERDPSNRRALRLDGYTKAQRLSYLLWNTTPDEELLQAAASGELHTAQGVDKQVARLMASPRMESGVRAFFTDVMQLELFETVTKDAGVYPKYSQSVIDSAREQTLRTIVDLTLTRKGDYRDIFVTPNTFVDRTLASVYRLPYLGEGATWRPYSYPASADQAGILTQVTFLSLHGHPGRTSPTKRGVALNEIFLCQETPLPPDDVDFTILNETENPLLKTVRARLLAHATEESCAGCHNMVDPIGLALERFDSIGQPRLIENGELIDVTAELDGVKFEGAKGIGPTLRTNPKIPACVVRNVYAYGVGRDPVNDWEVAYLEGQTKAFTSGGHVMPDMMSRIAKSPEFFRVVLPNAEAPKPAKTNVASTPSEAAKGKS